MKISKTALEDVFLVEASPLQDERGLFVKVFHSEVFSQANLNNVFKECYYSISAKNVIRGMHFQVPPQDHAKLVYVTKGSVTDVVLDIRKNSPTYGQHATFDLSEANRNAIYISAGFAHGFLALEDNTCVTYLQTTTYSPEHDSGIHIDSFGMNWDTTSPITSKRDQEFPALADFDSPFIYQGK